MVAVVALLFVPVVFAAAVLICCCCGRRLVVAVVVAAAVAALLVVALFLLPQSLIVAAAVVVECWLAHIVARCLKPPSTRSSKTLHARFFPTIAFFFLLLGARRIESLLHPLANFLLSRIFVVADPHHDDDDDAVLLLHLPKAPSERRNAKEPLLLLKPHSNRPLGPLSSPHCLRRK